MDRDSLVLTTTQVRRALYQLDGYCPPMRTIQEWAETGLARPSVRWGTPGIGCERLYNLSDMARIRLIVRLRRAGISMPRVRTMLAFLNGELRDALVPKSKWELVIDGPYNARLIARAADRTIDVPSGQFRLPLVDCVKGNLETVKALSA